MNNHWLPKDYDSVKEGLEIGILNLVRGKAFGWKSHDPSKSYEPLRLIREIVECEPWQQSKYLVTWTLEVNSRGDMYWVRGVTVNKALYGFRNTFIPLNAVGTVEE